MRSLDFAPVTYTRSRAVHCMLERICEVAVLPHVVFSILEPSGPNEPSLEELSRSVATDPGFAAKALVLANSAAYNRERQVCSVADAVEMLGFRTLRTLAMTAGTFEMFVGKNDPSSLRRRRWWRQSVDAAIAARWLAARTGAAPEEDAYTAALLHLTGKLLLDRYADQDYGQVTEMQASGEPDSAAETQVFGCSHIEVLCALAEQWHLPERLIDAFQYQTRPDFAHGHSPLRACVAVAARVSGAITLGGELGAGKLAECPEWALSMVGVTNEQLRFVLDEGIGALAMSQ